ncbi:MAG: AAA family ATPase [Pirellulaceae bacterium]
MYETFFGLQHLPFSSVPAPAQYMPFEAVSAAKESIERAVDRGEGPALLVGPAGTGKTLLCQLVARRFEDEFTVAMLANSKLCTRRALLQNILFELNLPFRNMEEGELRLSLMDYLDPVSDGDRGLLLIVDEAHTFSTRLLEELRLITNLVRNGQPRVRLLLSGSGRLEELIADPQLESFQQRIAARCYLHALTRDEVIEYIQGQLAGAGATRRVFSEDAYQAVYEASGGIPRVVNQICDHTLLLASVGGVNDIQAAGIAEAWTDLQQLPAPWASDETQPAAEHFIEFGSLDDDNYGDLSESDGESLGVDLTEDEVETIASNDDVAADSIESNDFDAADFDWQTVETCLELIENGQEENCWTANATMNNAGDERGEFDSFSSLVSGPMTSLDDVEVLLHEALREQASRAPKHIECKKEEVTAEELDDSPESDDEMRHIIPLASDPFGGEFAKETVVYDPAETIELPWRTPTVDSEEGIAISRSGAFDEVDNATAPICNEGGWHSLGSSSDDEEQSSEAKNQQEPILHVVRQSNDDVLLPFVPNFTEYDAADASAPEDESGQKSPIVPDLLQSDDRDLLIIEDSSTDVEISPSQPYEPTAERREYDELLIQLRQEH